MEGVFRKFEGRSAKLNFLKKYQREEGPFGSAGDRIPRFPRIPCLISVCCRAYEGKTFIAAFTIVRGCLGCGYIITWASAAPLLISLFPRDTGKVCSLITLGLNVGGIIGAPLGGFLYSVGGFAFPFWIVSSLHLLICSICYVGIPGGADGPQHENANHHQPSLKTLRDLLADPGVLSTCFAIMPVASVLGFIDVAFAAHLTQTYQIIKPGNLFLPFAITCAILSNLIGAFIDKGYTGIVFCFMGSMLGAITFLAMSQLKWILPRLTSLVTLEILLAFAALSVLCIINSSIPLLRKLFTRKNHNIPLVLLDAYAIIIFGISNCIGVVLGQCLVGGVILDKFGFYVSCLVISVSCAVTGLITGVILSKKKTLFRNPGHQPLISSSNSIIVEDSDSENLERDSNIVV